MKIVNFAYAGRQCQSLATDMDLMELYSYLYLNYGKDSAIFSVFDITEADYLTWKKNGYPSITRLEKRIQELNQ